jgi:hypothetical protein
VQVGAVLWALSISVNEESRFIAPALPALAIVLMWSLRQVRWPTLRWTVVVALFVQWGFVHAIALGWTAPAPESTSAWLKPLQRDSSWSHEIDRVLEVTEVHNSHPLRWNAVGVEEPWFNYATVSYHAQKLRLSLGHEVGQYTSLGYLLEDPERAVQRLRDMDSLYFITFDEGHLPDPANPFNRVSRAVLDRVRHSSECVPVPYASRKHVVVFERRPAR